MAFESDLRPASVDESELQFLERALLAATDRESRRIGQELHDNLCQQLLGAAFGAQAVALSLPADSAAATELRALARLINSAAQEVRDTARRLSPAILTADDLPTALQALADRPRAGLVCRLEYVRPVDCPSAESARQLYRIAQELLDNVGRHSGGTEAIVRLSDEGSHLCLQVTDNGRGFSPGAENTQGFGLRIAGYRARAVGGNIEIDTTVTGGASVKCTIPK